MRMIIQANTLDEFLRIAYDVRTVTRQAEERKSDYYFNLKPQDKTLSYGAKILVAGNDATMNNFV